ncbi:hypothetical protein L1887_06805 [Cichorium endivia]|nr:hypothetical protein L1887_06805 [Cichorium endivia]
MASSSSKHYVTQGVGEEYPYPSHVCAPNFVTFKLSGKDEYRIWKTQMLCLIESHCMLGFIDGTFVTPQTSDHHLLEHWRRSDALIKGWILGSLSNETLMSVLDRVAEKPIQETPAKRLWDELATIYNPAVSQLGTISLLLNFSR